MSNFLITIIIVDILVFTVTYGIYTYLFLKQRKKQREIYSKLEIDIDILEHKKENLNQEIEERQE
jgi:flagellar basal body-associated protein FliL